jgi:hypothetical protein
MIHRAIFLLLTILFSSCSAISQNIITVHLNDALQGNYFLNRNGLIKRVVYYGHNAGNDTLVYDYTNKGEIKKVVLHGAGQVIGFNEELEKKNIEDVIFKDSFLRSKGITFPLSFINSSELGDVATIFSVSDKYKIISEQDRKIILFDSLNQRIRFNSLIEKYISNSNLIEKYKITLDKGLLIMEELFFEDGVLVRKYRYNKKERLVSISYHCTYRDKSVLSEAKKFDYR